MAPPAPLAAIPEWARHRSTWLAWPHDARLWGDSLHAVQDEFVALCAAIVGDGLQGSGERLDILVADDSAESAARTALAGYDASFHRVAYGDIWLRDTAPVFVHDGSGLSAIAFRFNGWGGKYLLDHDADVASRVADAAGVDVLTLDWIGEGGALDFDGAGNCLASEACLLSPSRNGPKARARIEQSLADSFAVDNTIWLTAMLLADHTDGHVDTLARFISEDVVVCAEPRRTGDPNADALATTLAELRAAAASGGGFDVEVLPSPGAIVDAGGEAMPASYLNFYIANRAVVVPQYRGAYDEVALEAIARLFPDREVVGLSAVRILEGGGAFHCITQQQPLQAGG